MHFARNPVTIEKRREVESMKTVEESKYAREAGRLFMEGYNCAQSVFLAFCEYYDMDFETAARISSSFGGGMGRLREVCGSVSGMFMAAGYIYGYASPKDYEAKKEHYARIQELAEEFRKRNGSIVCRELLGLTKKKDDPAPSRRTEEYYKKRPCRQLIEMSAGIFHEYLEKNPPK